MSTAVDTWVADIAGYTEPARIVWCTGDRSQLGVIGGEAYADLDGGEKPEISMCTRRPEDVAGAGIFLTRAQATQRYWEPFRGSMRGRVMYVVPYELATGTPLAEVGVQITDDPRLVVELARTMHIDPSVRHAPPFVRSLHARHARCAPAICCFVEGRTIWAPAVAAQDFLAARAHALRLATTDIEATGRLPARMAIVEVTSGGKIHHVGVVAPFHFGRSQASLLGTSRSGTAYRIVASKVAWLTVDEDRSLRATLCERAEESDETEDASKRAPPSVVLSAIVFCTRRASLVPLVLEIPGWDNACYSGALIQADTAGRADSVVDPMGMRDLCGIDLNAYLAHWLALGPRLRRGPKMFQLNWFLRDVDDGLAWPGDEHAWRVIDWMVGRIESRAPATATVAGFAPRSDALDLTGLEVDERRWRALFEVEPGAWRAEVGAHEQALAQLGRGVPLELRRAHVSFATRVEEIAARKARAEEHQHGPSGPHGLG